MTGVFSGAPQTFGGLTLVRTTTKGTINHYRPGLLGADHQWRVGVQVEKGEHASSTIIPNGVRFVDSSRQPFQSISSGPSTIGGVFITAAGFVSDAITVGNSLTINAGLRFDHSRAISQDLRALDAEGRETDDLVRGLGTLYTWNVLSPRLGVTMKLSADGRTMLRASYGRFNQGVLTGELSPFHPAATPTTMAAFVPATGGYTSIVSVIDPRRNLQLDPETHTPRTDEYSVGIDREVGRRLAVAIAYVRKNGSNFIGWTDVGGQYREAARTLPDGRSLPVFVIVNDTAARRFLLTNPEAYSLTYNGLVMAAEKRRSDGWQAFGSYTLSRASGLQPSSGALAAGSQIRAPSPVRLSERSGKIRTVSPTRAAGCRTIARTCSVSWAAATSHGPAWWSLPICSTSAASRGRPRRRSRCRRATSAFCSNHAARVGCHRNRCSMCACRERSPSATWDASSCSWTCSMRSMTQRKRAWHRQSVQPEFRAAYCLHGSASCDGQRQGEPGSMTVGRGRSVTATDTDANRQPRSLTCNRTNLHENQRSPARDASTLPS